MLCRLSGHVYNHFPTFLSGNTLDLFCSNDPQRFVVYRSEKTYSDHDPIFTPLHVSSDDCFTPDVSKQKYSKKSFNTERFSCLLEPLYTKLYSNSQSNFLSTFDVSIKTALDDSCPVVPVITVSAQADKLWTLELKFDGISESKGEFNSQTKSDIFRIQFCHILGKKTSYM